MSYKDTMDIAELEREKRKAVKAFKEAHKNLKSHCKKIAQSLNYDASEARLLISAQRKAEDLLYEMHRICRAIQEAKKKR